ncbi:HAMP domain-containing sensor histidine kinase [Rugamonas sp.]|uniref:sensor histidine kinase n=1 Tax=Rugamonas sp. TaxID=1926287 RepID=UPI0025D4B882|nr:HAMP domain-containing sensor histidine kinase [Rugamonas sp.]
MPRLYIRFYLALMGSLLLFALATVFVWHRAGGPMERAGATMGQIVQNVLAPADAPPAEQQAALERVARGLGADISLYSADWRLLAAVGQPIARPQWRMTALAGPPPYYSLRAADGRRLLSSQPLGYIQPKLLMHTLLLILALAIGVGAFPIVRHLTRRLERLQRGVESLGAGDLTARVAVEGRDEVAALAHSFNRAANQIEQLVGAHKALLANASHELRTPLARIRLALELVKESIDGKRKAGLEQDIAELDHLLDEILLASRLGAASDRMDHEEIDLLALAAEECARYDDVQLDARLAAGPALVSGDARLLRRVLRNLLENARRHGVAPTSVRIASDAAGMLTLWVWDSGPGIPVAEFERVFEPFYRRPGAHGGGTGLGLALVRQIARRHGGEARCVAMADGRSGFVVTLPARPAPR